MKKEHRASGVSRGEQREEGEAKQQNSKAANQRGGTEGEFNAKGAKGAKERRYAEFAEVTQRSQREERGAKEKSRKAEERRRGGGKKSEGGRGLGEGGNAKNAKGAKGAKSARRVRVARELDPDAPPRTVGELGVMLRKRLGIEVPATAIEEGSSAPMAYLAHTFFEGRRFVNEDAKADERDGADCVVWANRGGGKTFLGAVATMLDLVFKHGVQVRILGGSLEQSARMQEHLRVLFEHESLRGLVKRGRAGSSKRRLALVNGSTAEVLAASETSVRGVRVQKVRCDEVELFDRDLWRAVQLTTRSLRAIGPWGGEVRGAVEALSTMHQPFGLMAELTGCGEGRVTRRVFRWGLIDVLEQCGHEHQCASCNLWTDCRGKAKQRAEAGHVRIGDARAMKLRVDESTWRSEMLCGDVRSSDLVYPEFDARRHVYGEGSTGLGGPEAGWARGTRGWVMGMDFGFRDDTAVLLGRVDDAGGLWIEREHVARERMLSKHLGVMRAWADEVGGPGMVRWVAVDPSGNARNQQTGRSNVHALREMGFAVAAGGSRVADGVRMVRARLAPASGTARLFVHARCVRLIDCLRQYHYDARNLKSREPVKGEHDHACDALRYMVLRLDGRVRVRSGGW